jgi:hypothetical protein
MSLNALFYDHIKEFLLGCSVELQDAVSTALFFTRVKEGTAKI